MKRRLILSSLFACVLALVWCVSASQVAAQEKGAPPQKGKAAAKSPQTKGGQNVSDKAQQPRGNAQDDPNIQKRTPNNSSKQTQPPPNKVGQATRGQSICAVHVDNRTPWDIDVYIDRRYSGTVGGWGDIYPLAGSGPTRFYARAEFTDGSIRTWGPRLFECEPGAVFTWTLNP